MSHFFAYLNRMRLIKRWGLMRNLREENVQEHGLQVAVIARRPHGYFITHVEGKQFPMLNGQALNAQAHPLGDHDVIEIAGIKMEFFLKA